ncbi:hypothetical protein BACSTE_03759 [Bacteroides stercoris ATCC 43183]|uniref:Uncharacterized protein n=1 Tax=Bacteroides stercoris ATCC 43183 TaxID=449673 RepID=B0NW77_BACSE|nr:hypothetical protein BACSTE_03759 [Bacteroides stercoris ATCC 43183]
MPIAKTAKLIKKCFCFILVSCFYGINHCLCHYNGKGLPNSRGFCYSAKASAVCHQAME